MPLHVRGAKVLASSIVIGFAAGLGVAAVLTGLSVLAANQGTALLLSVVLVAALLVLVPGGWAALILHYRTHPRWLTLAAAGVLLASALIGLGLGLVGQGFNILTVWAGALVLLLCELIAATVIPAPGGPRRGLSWHVLAGIAWPAAVASGMYLVSVAFTMLVMRPH